MALRLLYNPVLPNKPHLTYIHELPRFFDPIFAVCVGVSAAALRIRREERDKYPDQNNELGALWTKGLRMGRGYVGGYPDGK